MTEYFSKILNTQKSLTLKQPMYLSYRNQAIDCSGNQLTGFYMRGSLVVKGLTYKE